MALYRRVKLSAIILGCCLIGFSSVGCAGHNLLARGRNGAPCEGSCKIGAGRAGRCRDSLCKQHCPDEHGGSGGPDAEADPAAMLLGRFHPVPTKPVFGLTGASVTEPVPITPAPIPAPLPPPAEDPQELPEMPEVQEPVPVEPTEARRGEGSPLHRRASMVPSSMKFLTR